MMSELTRLHAEALRLLTTYEEHKDSKDKTMRRKAHLDLDYFLMANREVAAMLIVDGLQNEIDKLRNESEHKKRPAKRWYKRILGGTKLGNRNNKINQETLHP